MGIGFQPPFEQAGDKFVQTYRRVFTAFANVVALATSITPFEILFAEVPFTTDTSVVSPGNIDLPPTEAMRVVQASYCRCSGDGSALLRCESLVLALNAKAAEGEFFPLRAWPGNYSGNALGEVGQFLNVTDQELFLGSDVSPQATGKLQFSCLADVQNTDAAPHDVQISGMLTLEFYRLTTTSRMRG